MSSTTESERIDKDIAVHLNNDYQSCSSSSSTTTTFPHYSRSNWDGVELPRHPSLTSIDDNEKNRRRYFDVVPKQTTTRNQVFAELAEQEEKIHKKKHTPVPIHVRKLEIELEQRKLPRCPSKTHRTDACFYPLRSSTSSSLSDNEFDNTQNQYSQNGLSSKEPNDDGAYSSNEEDDFTIEENEYLSTEDERSEEEEEEVNLSQIGIVSTSLQAMIFQAQLELRCRQVPEQHKINFKPSVMEAILVGRNTRLNEHTVEAYGTQCEKYKPLELPSDTWVKGQEYVTFPKINNNPNPAPFVIFSEAVALGGIKALKPKITTNYDTMLASSHDEDVDVDDMNKHKLIRTMYLTDMYLHREFRENDKDNDEIEHIHYESLDDVKLPTDQCPVFKRVTQEMNDLELKEAIPQQVTEKIWDRRYRLERPRAEQRIKSHCRCIYCKTTSPYQTLAYRKKWLTQQGLWNEPQIEQEECNTTEDITYEVHLPNEDDQENKHDEIICLGTKSNPPLAQLGSDSFHVESVSSGFDSENSIDRKDTNVPIEDINRVSILPESLSVVPRTIPASTYTSGKTRVNPKKTLVDEVKKILNLSRHSEHSTGSRRRRRMIKNNLNSIRSLFGPSSHGREKYP